MKVYVVTSGEYSNYCIELIASTREKAEECRKKLWAKNKALYGYEQTVEVNEWEVDEDFPVDEPAK